MAQRRDWKAFLKAQKGKKDNWLILLLVGILLLVIAMPVSNRNQEEQEDTEGAGTQNQASETITDSSYVSKLERRLEESLRQVEGVGQVSVMITLSASSEKVVEKDLETSSDSTSSTDGDSQSSSSSSTSETSVYSGNSGDETPYVKKELSPEIEGVLVIAEGGNDAVVIENITEAVQALFGVDTHKIKVMKRN